MINSVQSRISKGAQKCARSNCSGAGARASSNFIGGARTGAPLLFLVRSAERDRAPKSKERLMLCLLATTELGELISIYSVNSLFRNFAHRYPDISAVVRTVLGVANRETITCVFPLISVSLARLAVLPASSAHVEILFSTTKRVTTAQRYKLITTTLDIIIHFSADPQTVWNLNHAMRMWEYLGKRRLLISFDLEH